MATIDNPGQIDRLEAFVVDLNGTPRGKWVSGAKAQDVFTAGLALPKSVFALDIEGSDVGAAGLAFGTGDPDGISWPVASSMAPVPWAEGNVAQVLLTMVDEQGTPFFADPRAMLARAIDRFTAAGLQPTAAVELEFCLFREGSDHPVAILPSPWGSDGNEVLSLAALEGSEAVLRDMMSACADQQLVVESALSENAPGQFEINTKYRTDALRAADEAIILKRCIKSVARKHGMIASFMAKPLGDRSGNGMHVHVSLVDEDGKSQFSIAQGQPGKVMRNAIGGLLAHMPDSMLAFAPHGNSFRRFRTGSHAPVTACWGVDDRTAAIRAIPGDASAVRLEHRLPGADANPYLALALILTAMLDGIERGTEPGDPAEPSADGAGGQPLPLDWRQAIERFANSQFVADALGGEAQRVITACKWQDYDKLLSRVSDVEHQLYLTQA